MHTLVESKMQLYIQNVTGYSMQGLVVVQVGSVVLALASGGLMGPIAIWQAGACRGSHQPIATPTPESGGAAQASAGDTGKAVSGCSQSQPTVNH